MPVTTPSLTVSRAGAALAAVAAALTVPSSAAAWSWQDLLKPAAPVTETVTETVDQVTEPVAPVTEPVTDTVDAVVDSLTGTGTVGCPEGDVRKAFARFGDTADYSLAPGGDFETGSGWTLKGGAKLVSGNETLGVQPGTRSLKLPIGATALSPEFCVDETQPHFRFVSKPDNAIAGYEAIVLYRNTEGAVKQAQFTSSASQSWGSGTWAPSSTSPLATKIPLLAGGNTASVQLLFVSTGNKLAFGVGLWGRLTGGNVGTVSVDSVMVDPYRRG